MIHEITYTDVNVYKIPDLITPDDGLGEEVYIGIWGQRRCDYLKNHSRVLYINLLTSGKLRAHLHEIDVSAFEQWELIIEQMKKAEGVTEQLKADDMMKWVGMVNNIRNRADEIIYNEFIYN